MHLLSCISTQWQKWLPALSIIGIAAWIAVFRHEPTSERALFAALLVIYMVHQIEEHLWPGGFRQFTNAHVFKSGNDDFPVDVPGVALINAFSHIVTSIRLRIYNPGLVTSIVLFLPFTIFVLWFEATHGLLSGSEVGLVALAGVVLHIPVAALFVVPFLRRRAAAA